MESVLEYGVNQPSCSRYLFQAFKEITCFAVKNAEQMFFSLWIERLIVRNQYNPVYQISFKRIGYFLFAQTYRFSNNALRVNNRFFVILRFCRQEQALQVANQCYSF